MSSSARQPGWPLTFLVPLQFYVFHVFAQGIAEDPGWTRALSAAIAAAMLFLVVRNCWRLWRLPAASASKGQLVGLVVALVLVVLLGAGPVSVGVVGPAEVAAGALAGFVALLIGREGGRLLAGRHPAGAAPGDG